MDQKNQSNQQNQLTLQQAIALLQESGYTVKSGRKTAPSEAEKSEIKKLLANFTTKTFIYDRGEIRTPKFLYR